MRAGPNPALVCTFLVLHHLILQCSDHSLSIFLNIVDRTLTYNHWYVWKWFRDKFEWAANSGVFWMLYNVSAIGHMRQLDLITIKCLKSASQLTVAYMLDLVYEMKLLISMSKESNIHLYTLILYSVSLMLCCKSRVFVWAKHQINCDFYLIQNWCSTSSSHPPLN